MKYLWIFIFLTVFLGALTMFALGVVSSVNKCLKDGEFELDNILDNIPDFCSECFGICIAMLVFIGLVSFLGCIFS